MKESSEKIIIKSEIEEPKDSKSTWQGIKYGGVGMSLILLSILFHTIHLVENPSKIQVIFNEITAQLLSHLGIGFLAIGILTFILDMSHWTSYFEKRLSNIVMKSEYLNSLSKSELSILERKILKVYFDNSDDIEIKESFLTYYQKNIQKFIGKPYRKDVVMHLTLTETKAKAIDSDEEIELFEVSEIMTYICKKNGEHLQENICYLPDEFEHFSTDSFYVKLQHPELKNIKSSNIKNEIIFTQEKLKEINAIKETVRGFDLDIKDYIIDELNVTVKAIYKIRKDRFFGWRMSHPTLNLTFIVDYPTNYIISKEFYFSEDNSFTCEDDELRGNFFLKNSEWLLPDEGLTLQLTKR